MIRGNVFAARLKAMGHRFVQTGLVAPITRVDAGLHFGSGSTRHFRSSFQVVKDQSLKFSPNGIGPNTVLQCWLELCAALNVKNNSEGYSKKSFCEYHELA